MSGAADREGTYALVWSTGELTFRAGGPDRMLRDVSLDATPPYEFTLVSAAEGGPGLHGCVSAIDRPVAAPNPLAATVVAALGGRFRDRYFGTLGLCGSRLGNPTGLPELCGLISAQQRLIRSIHAVARERRW